MNQITKNSLSRSIFKYCTTIRGVAMTSNTYNKALEDLKNNPYYEKYSKRIADLQRNRPEEFEQRTSRPAATPPARAPALPDTRQYSSVLNPKPATAAAVGPTTVNDKKLEDLFKLDLVQDKTALEIQAIWEEYHKNKEVISATIPVDQYTTIHRTMCQYPTFLFPLPRAQGYEFMMCQNSGHSVHFTPLLAYQVHKENAPECLTVTHYLELSDKEIVLMRGEYDKNVLNGQEAQCLANQFQMYYSGRDAAKVQLLDTFTNQPNSFKHMDLIAQMENIGLS